jgi:hypothetical protein
MVEVKRVFGYWFIVTNYRNIGKSGMFKTSLKIVLRLA